MALLTMGSVYNTPVFVLRTEPNPRLKKVYGANWSRANSAWRFPAFYPVHTRVLSDLKAIMPELVYSEDVQKHIEVISQEVELPDDFSFITAPFQHQREGLLHIYRNYRAGLFYDPGLGKTKVVVDLYRLLQQPMLIFCPRIMLHDWVAEFKKHGNIDNVIVLDGTKKAKLKSIKAAQDNVPAATIVTYSTARLYQESIIQIPYDIVVADESHQMKTPFSKRTQAAQALAARAYRRILLSGTPSLGSPFDLYGQLRFLGKYFCSEDWWAFKKKFGVFPEWELKEGRPRMLLGFKNTDLMRDRVLYVCTRKTKDECLDLPERQILDVVFDLAPKQKKAYNNLISERCDPKGFGYLTMMEEEELNHTAGPVLEPHLIVTEEVVLFGKLDQVSSGFLYKTRKNPRYCDGCQHVQACTQNNVRPYTTECEVTKKPPPRTTDYIGTNAREAHLKELLTTLLEDDTHKVIVWANLIEELDQIQKTVEAAGYEYVRVAGGVDAQALQERKKRFNTDATCRVYIGQVQTGIGVTLNAANYTIYYSLPWSLEHYLQSIDRNYRIGQERKVTVYRLLARHTLDVTKAAALDQKKDFSDLVTKSATCATCSQFATRCAKFNVELFDPDCIYDRTMLRHTAKVSLIP